jgi:nitrite reductase (NADH) large subunit
MQEGRFMTDQWFNKLLDRLTGRSYLTNDNPNEELGPQTAPVSIPVFPRADDSPIVIIGAGAAGIRAAQELVRLDCKAPIILYGEEPWDPYSRVRLSQFVAHQLDWQSLIRDQNPPAAVVTRYGCKVVSIDRKTRCIMDDAGRVQPYSRIVLAKGSRPFIPDIPGIDLAGIFTFRNLSDAEKLLARQVRSRRTAILGGGLLGLEAARAMQRFNTEVVVVELADRLMPRQLDVGAAAELKRQVENSGISVILGDGVDCVIGTDHVSGLRLASGKLVACDTLVVATGIVPNVDLARQTGLKVARGVLVNSSMQTSDPDIYAVGECAEHPERRGARAKGARIYGAAGPSLEQAGVAARVIVAGGSRYAGGPVATRLKVLDAPVFSMGRVREDTLLGAQAHTFTDSERGIYRKLTVHQGKLVGAISIGEWAELGRIQEAITQNRALHTWDLWRFRRSGNPWSDHTADTVVDWPATATVCNCTGVTRGQLGAAIAKGCSSVAALSDCTGASRVCGSCRPLLEELVGSNEKVEPERGYKTLIGGAVVAFALALLAWLAPNIPYPDSFDLTWQWDKLWRDNFMKQVTGYSALALMAAGLITLTLRKRWPRFKFGDFPIWRVLHVVMAIGSVLALLAHTGARLGSHLNLGLAACIFALIVTGAAASLIIGGKHGMDGKFARKIRAQWTWAHIVLFWPVPLLLTFHVVKGYYY